MGLGLKDWKPPFSWHHPLRNLQELWYEIKYGFQRLWIGYDNGYLYDLDVKLNELIPKILTWQKCHGQGYPVIDNEVSCHDDWLKILDKILYYFSEANNDTCSQKNEFDFNDNRWLEHEKYVAEYRAKYRKEAYKMIAEYIDNFWD